MAAFDFVIATIARYSNQHITGYHVGLTKFSSGQVTFAVSQTSTNHKASYNELFQRGSAEDNRTRQLIMTVLNTIRKLGGSLKGISNYLNSDAATQKLQEISSVVTDPNVLRMLFNEQQIMLLASTVEGLTAAAQNPSSITTNDTSYHADSTSANKEIAILDESDVPAALQNALTALFGTSEFASTEAVNKRIITVGIPLGFTQRLKQKVNIQKQKKASFQTKPNDIVQVTVYKVDLQNAEIVYKPVKFLFELARFPTRFSTSAWLSIPDNASINDVVGAIPTQCYTQSPESGTANSITSGIEYASTVIADNEGHKNSRAAFSDSTYDFLTSAQKAELLHNHVVSQLLEAYIKLMTGINVAEHNYDMVEAPPPMESSFVKTLVEHTVAHVSNVVSPPPTFNPRPYPIGRIPTGGLLFGSTGGQTRTTSGRPSQMAMVKSVQPASVNVQTLERQQQIGSVAANLDLFSHRDVPMVISYLKTLTNFSNTLSTVSNIDALNHKVLIPKQFDRVFNVVIDPRDFEIDYQKTVKTPFGKNAFNLLVSHGEIVPASESENPGRVVSSPHFQMRNTTGSKMTGRAFTNGGRSTPNVSNFVFRDRSKTQGDLITDKYFVTIETMDEGTD
jgi:hypothetical protein